MERETLQFFDNFLCDGLQTFSYDSDSPFIKKKAIIVKNLYLYLRCNSKFIAPIGTLNIHNEE